MIKKLNHQEFIKLCSIKGINISKITKKFVHIVQFDAINWNVSADYQNGSAQKAMDLVEQSFKNCTSN